MKALTIKKNIKQKVDDWIDSISDEHLQNLCRKNTIVTGGCIASMFLQEPVNDYDIYFANFETARAVADYYASELNSTGSAAYVEVKTEGDRVEFYVTSDGVAEDNGDEGEKKPYRAVFISPNAVTLSDKIQLIIRFHGDPEEIHKNYDFVHATNYWTRDAGLVTNAKALESILAKELQYQGSLYPLASIFRTRKFLQRNWTCHLGNYIKMALQLNEMDLFDPNILREQLVGVDMAYMGTVMNAISDKQHLDPSFKFDASYLCEVVDRMMNFEERETI